MCNTNFNPDGHDGHHHGPRHGHPHRPHHGHPHDQRHGRQLHSHHGKRSDLPDVVEAKIAQVERSLGDTKTNRRLCRFAFHEGPHHNRSTKSVIAIVLFYLGDRSDDQQSTDEEEIPAAGVNIPFSSRHDREGEGTFQIPTRLLQEVFGEDQLKAVVEELEEGPEPEVAFTLICLQLLERVYQDPAGKSDLQDE